MQTLGAITGAVTPSSTFETTRNGKVWVLTEGTTFGTITLQFSVDNGTTAFASFYPDGVEAAFTYTQMAKVFDLPAGVYFRFLGDASTAAITIYVSGDNINVL